MIRKIKKKLRRNFWQPRRSWSHHKKAVSQLMHAFWDQQWGREVTLSMMPNTWWLHAILWAQNHHELKLEPKKIFLIRFQGQNLFFSYLMQWINFKKIWSVLFSSINVQSSYFNLQTQVSDGQQSHSTWWTYAVVIQNKRQFFTHDFIQWPYEHNWEWA